MTKADKLQDALEALGSAGVAAGFGDALYDTAADLYEDIFNSLEQWGENCERRWIDNAPWETGNLRDSIAYDIDVDNLESWVGVDVDTLLLPAGQERPFRRTEYYYKYGGGEPMVVDSQIMPDYDYTMKANENAVSAGGANPPAGKGVPTPFIDEIWRVIAAQEKERIFGNG